MRWLKNFESPYISHQLANRSSDETGMFYKIVVRRVCWDPSIEEQLLDDPGALKILYLQVSQVSNYTFIIFGVNCIC